MNFSIKEGLSLALFQFHLKEDNILSLLTNGFTQKFPICSPYLSREFGENTAVSFSHHRKNVDLRQFKALRQFYMIKIKTKRYSYIFNKFAAIKQF